MTRIGSGGGGPLWPTNFQGDDQNLDKAKSELEKAMERAQHGLDVNPLANTPPAELEAAETDEDSPERRVQPSSETSADTHGGNQDQQDQQEEEQKADPYANIPWHIREQLDL